MVIAGKLDYDAQVFDAIGSESDLA